MVTDPPPVVAVGGSMTFRVCVTGDLVVIVGLIVGMVAIVSTDGTLTRRIFSSTGSVSIATGRTVSTYVGEIGGGRKEVRGDICSIFEAS
mmetsp:Transcript_18458/g.33062  ORF Transcript_18458/g.33062 Transcript_18458/m.33062 type:complete len:90 (+) Transcript_18458:40-309(+)